MGCAQSTPSGTEKKKKGATKAKQKKVANAKTSRKAQQTKLIKGSKDKDTPSPAVGKGSRPSQATNPLDFTKEEPLARDRLSSITSSSASVREQLINAQTQLESKSVVAEHTPLSENKLKNLRVWVDSTDKKDLLDPQDATGLQRREREREKTVTLPNGNPNGFRGGKRGSILLAFTDVSNSQTGDDGDRTDMSVIQHKGGDDSGSEL